MTHQVFAAAVDDKLIQQSPCRKIRLPKDDREEVEIPTVDEVLGLRDAMDDWWQAIVTTLAGTGARIGEVLGLDLADVDFLRREVSIERQRRQDGTLGPLKTKKARQVVPVGQVVIDALAAHLASFPTDGPLFVDEIGDALCYRRWRSLAEAAASEAKVDVTAHTLRHFYASALIAAGASVKQVQERLGHSSRRSRSSSIATSGPVRTTGHATRSTSRWRRLRTLCGLEEPEMPSVAGQTACAAAWAFFAFLKSRTFCSEPGSTTSATER